MKEKSCGLPAVFVAAAVMGLVVGGAQAQAQAQPATGRALLQLCDASNVRPADRAACGRTLKSWLERLRREVTAMGDNPWFCPPEDESDQEALARLYVEWAAETPEALDAALEPALRAAFETIFPCGE